MKKIIFVCNGNIHRSVIAAECLRTIFKKQNIDSEYFVDSYGIQGTMGTELPEKKQLLDYAGEWNAAKRILQVLDIDISNHFSQVISKSVVEGADVIIAMDKNVFEKAKNSLIKQFPEYKYKMCCFCNFTIHNKMIEDPSGNYDVKIHKRIIKNIYETLNNRFEDILNCARDKNNS